MQIHQPFQSKQPRLEENVKQSLSDYLQILTPQAKRGRKKKKPRVRNLPDWVKIERIQAIVDNWDGKLLAKYFFIMSYLLGSRVSETISIRRGDCEVITKDGVEFLDITVKTEKTAEGKKDWRTVPIPLNGIEHSMVMQVLDFMKLFTSPEKLFNVSRFTAYRWMKKVDFGAMFLKTPKNERIRVQSWYGYPHYLRHVRASHLARYYDFKEREQMLYFGWSSPSMPARYSHVEHDDLILAYKKKGG